MDKPAHILFHQLFGGLLPPSEYSRIVSLSLFLAAAFPAPALNPIRNIPLSISCYTQRPWRNIGGYGRTGRHVSTRSDFNWSHQIAVAADKSPVLNHCAVFILAVVVAGDGSCTNINSTSDTGISQISSGAPCFQVPQWYS